MMKKQLMMMVLCLVMGAVGFAQGDGGGGRGQNRTPEERAKMTIERISPDLNPSKEQLVGLDSVFVKFYKAQGKLREGLQPGERPSREAMEKAYADRDTDLKKVLTEEQFKKLKAREEEMRQQRQQRGGGGGGQQNNRR